MKKIIFALLTVCLLGACSSGPVLDRKYDADRVIDDIEKLKQELTEDQFVHLVSAIVVLPIEADDSTVLEGKTYRQLLEIGTQMNEAYQSLGWGDLMEEAWDDAQQGKNYFENPEDSVLFNQQQ